MRISAGSKLGSYQVLSLLGAGGMGEVYRARDTRLGREVAIKVLPAARMADESRRRRFEQEARAASALDHPNIVTIYEIDSADGIDFIVMEYVPGRSLALSIPRQGMRVPEVLRIAIPLADALARAHARGIVHRDLKPANIVVSREGVVKVLDFGLAKLMAGEEAGGQPQAETTETAAGPLSHPGTVVGTAGYMSPEQATGGRVDARSDVFSFGAVLYQMLTGRQAFAAPSTAEALAAVVRDQPKAPSEVVPGVPRDLERLILRCLQKTPERRFQHMLDVKLELEEIEEGASTPAASAVTPRRRGWRRLAAGIGLVVASAGLAGWRLARPPRASAPASLPTRLTREPGMQTDPALSPDGKLVVYAADFGGNVDLWVKQVSGGPPVRITDDPRPDWQADWSPDGSRIVFRSERDGGGLYIVSALGGTAQAVASFGYEPRFSPDGSRVLFQSDRMGVGKKIFVVDVGRGEPRAVPVGKAPNWVWGASWHPDGTRVSFQTFVGDRPNWARTWRTVSLEDGAVRDTDFSAAVAASIWPSRVDWAPSGDRVFIQGWSGESSGLWRARIDPATLRLSDVEPVTVGAGEQHGFHLSHDGRSAVFVVSHARYYTWSLPFDAATGHVKGEGEALYEGVHSAPCELSREGDRLACGGADGLWIGDVRTRTRVSLFADATANQRGDLPSLSPDGRYVAYQRDGGTDAANGVYVATIDGRDEHLVRSDAPRASFVYGWSPDGRGVVGTTPRVPSSPESQVWLAPAFPVAGAEEQVLASSTTEDLWNSRLSPDGRWLAFQAVDDGGQAAVWVVSRSGGERRRMDSGDWDDVPRWSPDGRILYVMPRRAGFWNIWGIPFDPHSGRAGGEPFQVTRFERPSRMIVDSFSFYGVSRDRLVLGLADLSGSVWRVENIDGR